MSQSFDEWRRWTDRCVQERPAAGSRDASQIEMILKLPHVPNYWRRSRTESRSHTNSGSPRQKILSSKVQQVSWASLTKAVVTALQKSCNNFGVLFYTSSPPLKKKRKSFSRKNVLRPWLHVRWKKFHEYFCNMFDFAEKNSVRVVELLSGRNLFISASDVVTCKKNYYTLSQAWHSHALQFF